MRYTNKEEIKLRCCSVQCQDKDNDEATFYPEVHEVDTNLGPALAYNAECPDCDVQGVEI